MKDLHQFLEPKRSPIERPTIFQIALWVILTLLAIYQSLRNFSAFQIGVYQDDASYVVLAQSLVKADRYGLINFPGEPRPTRYPFGFPLLLSPFARFFPGDPDMMKFLSLTAVIVNSVLLFWGWRSFSRSTSYWWGLALSGLMILSPITHGLSRTIMSEPVFTSLGLIAIMLAEMAIWRKTNPGWHLGISLILTMVVFTRTAGIAILLAVFGFWLMVRGVSMLKEITWVLAGMIGWVSLILILTPVTLDSLVPVVYLRQIEDPAAWGDTGIEGPFLQRSFSALQEYTNSLIKESVFPIGGGETEKRLSEAIGLPFLPKILGTVVTVIIALGFGYWLKREGLNLPVLTALIYLGVLLSWPWRLTRFLYPIQFQFIFGFLLGLAFLGTVILGKLRFSIPERKAGTLTAVLVVLLLALFAYKNFEKDTSVNHTGDLRQRTAWIGENTPSGSIIMTEKPQVDFLYSDRKTIPFQAISSLVHFSQYIQDTKADYILITPELTWMQVFTPYYSDKTQQLLTWLKALSAQGQVKRVYASETDKVQVFQVIH